MVELACEGEPRFEVSRLEENTAPSYSVDTIGKVRAGLRAEDELFFIIGADAFAEIGTWRRWQEVARAVCFLVVSRPGHSYDVPAGVRFQRLDSVSLDVSSSHIREQLSRGGCPEDVPESVLAYIVEHGLYGLRTA